MEEPPKAPNGLPVDYRRPDSLPVTRTDQKRSDAESAVLAELLKRQGEYTLEIESPSDEYFKWFADSLDAIGVRIVYDGTTRKLSGNVDKLSAEALASIRKHGTAFTEYMLRTGRVPIPTGRAERLEVAATPRPNTRVEWVEDLSGGPEQRGVCAAEELATKTYTMWRYIRTRRWYAVSGWTWED